MSNIVVAVLLFLAGALENAINAWLIRASSHGKTLQSFISGTLYVLVWMVALKSIVENINNSTWLVVCYAVGSGVGSSLLVYISNKRKRQNAKPTSKTMCGCS